MIKSAYEYLQAAPILSRHHQLSSTHKAGQALWLCYRFNLSHRDIEDLLAERGITVTRESIRFLCINFEAIFRPRLKRKYGGYGDTFDIDEIVIKINGKQHHPWRSVDQNGEVVDVHLQAK